MMDELIKEQIPGFSFTPSDYGSHKEGREYFDTRHGYLDLGSLGIRDVRLIAI